MLGPHAEQHAVFEHWALRWQAMEFRQQYLELQRELSMGIAVTGRTELVRAAG